MRGAGKVITEEQVLEPLSVPPGRNIMVRVRVDGDLGWAGCGAGQFSGGEYCPQLDRLKRLFLLFRSRSYKSHAHACIKAKLDCLWACMPTVWGWEARLGGRNVRAEALRGGMGLQTPTLWGVECGR